MLDKGEQVWAISYSSAPPSSPAPSHPSPPKPAAALGTALVLRAPFFLDGEAAVYTGLTLQQGHSVKR